MSYKPGDAYYGEFTTQVFSTGVATNADSLPVATANHNGADDGSFTLTVTNLDTGRYKITGTVPGGYTKGDVVSVSVAATVSTIAGKAVVDSFILDSKRVGDLNDIAATAIVSGGAINTSSGKISEVVLVDTLTTYAGNTPQTGDSFARIGSTGSGLTSLAPAATALSTAEWTNTLAANLGAIYAKLPTNGIADETLVIAATNSILSAVGSPLQASAAVVASLAGAFTVSGGSILTIPALQNAPSGGGGGGGSDPLLNEVPGGYGEGTAGFNVGQIPAIQSAISEIEGDVAALQASVSAEGGLSVIVTSAIAQSGDIQITRGDDYQAVDGLALIFTITGLPNLTAASVTFGIINGKNLPATLLGSGSVLSGADSGPQTVQVQLTSAETMLVVNAYAAWEYCLRFTTAHATNITPVRGSIEVLQGLV